MEFFRRSLLRKYGLLLLILLVVSGGILAGFYFWIHAPILWIEAVGAIFALFVLITFCVHFFSFHRPLHKILHEMKALLAGRKYNRIYSTRLDEWGVMSHFFNEVTKNIEKISATVKEEKRMSSELAIATDIQKMVLPISLPEVPGLDIYASTRAAAEIGGDNYDVIRSRDNTFLYVGDVTGHGVPAGLVMMMANALIDVFTEQYQSAYDVVVQANRMLKPRIQSTMFMTMVMLRWEEVQKKMRFVGCGHEYILTFRKKLGICETKQSGGIALGMLPDNSKIIKEEELPFEAEDFILLYSDGIVEAQNTSGEMYGLARLKTSIEKFAPQSKTSHELFGKVMQEFSAFVEDQVQNDDITLMVIKQI